MSVLSFLQRFRFTYRSNAVQSFGRNIQECSHRCSLLQWEQILWLWPNPWSTAIQGSWLWRLTSEDSVIGCTLQYYFKLLLYCVNSSVQQLKQNHSWPDLSSWDDRQTSSCVLEIVDPVRFACCQTLLVWSLVWSGVCAPSGCVSWLCYSWWRICDRKDRALWSLDVSAVYEPSGWSRNRRFVHRKDISVLFLKMKKN